MGRTKTLRSIDAKIEILKEKIQKTKARYDNLCSELGTLQQERENVMAHEILVALKSIGAVQSTYRSIFNTFMWSAIE